MTCWFLFFFKSQVPESCICMRISVFAKKIYSSLPWLHRKSWRWNGDMHLYFHVGLAWKRIGFGCLGVGVMFFGGWECLLHYMQNYMQNHNYSHLWAGTLISATHILGEAGKWVSDFLKLTVRMGRAILDCAMIGCSTDCFCIPRKSYCCWRALGGRGDGEEKRLEKVSQKSC